MSELACTCGCGMTRTELEAVEKMCCADTEARHRFFTKSALAKLFSKSDIPEYKYGDDPTRMYEELREGMKYD